MANDMLLYWGSGSGPCWRVMLVLAEKGLSYKDKLLSFDKKEHKSEEILQLNPRGQVPTFKHGDIVINESTAICEYLEVTFKGQGPSMIPDDPKERALVLQKMFEAENLKLNCLAEVVLYHWRTKKEDKTQEEIERRQETCRKELALWEEYLNKRDDKTFIAGKNFSLADCVFFPFLAWLMRMGLSTAKYPRLSAYYNRLCERPSVKATWPPHWKTSEGSDMLKDI